MFKKILRIVLLIALLGTFAWTIYFLYSKSQKPPIVAKTIQPLVTTIYQKTVANGSIIPKKEILIKPQVSGIIDKIFVQPGQHISQGDVIAKVRIIPNMANLNAAETRLNQAKISLENANLEFDRNKTLFDQKIIPLSDFQQVQYKVKTAKEELAAAESNFQIIKEGSSKNSGQVTNTLIRSTISGMVLDVPVKEGNSVIESNTFNEGTTIASVADMGIMIFEGKVDESEVGKIHQGMELVLTVGALQNKKFKAILEYIAPKGVTENGAIQFLIKAAVAMDASTFLRAGYSANADIILAHKDSVMTVQESVLQFAGDTTFVEVEKKKGFFEKRTIKTGLSDGINIEVLSGLALSDKLKLPEMIDTKAGVN